MWDYLDHCKASVLRCLKTSHGERSAKLAELYELEMLGRELGMISGSMVGRKHRGGS